MSDLTTAGLTGPARRLFNAWRELGRTEAQALEEVRRSGIVEEQRRASQAAELQEAELNGLIATTFGRARDPVIDDVDKAVAGAFGRAVKEA